MIRNQWYAILESSEVRPGKPVGVTRMGERLVLWRDRQGRPACLVDRCPHRGVALSTGKLVEDRVQCPFHGFEFDPGGRCTVIPANGMSAPVPKAFQAAGYPLREQHGFLWLWWGEPRDSLPPVRLFDALTPSMSYATIRDHWKTHYSRAIENQLDVMHLPFIHYNTIGRGNRTLIDGPVTHLESDPAGDLLNVWMFSRVEDGTRPRKPEELLVGGRSPTIQFRFPNLWHLWLGDALHLVAAFAPIDDGNVMLYVRACQSFVTAPGLRQVVNWVSRASNQVVLNQDKHVVETQRPLRTDLRMGEKLVQGDGPIIAYRRRRAELIEAAVNPTAL